MKSTSWIIDARWYYAPLAFFLGIIAREDGDQMRSLVILGGSLFFVLLCNIFFSIYIRKTEKEFPSDKSVGTINILQIALDLLFFFTVMMFTGGGVSSVGHSFFFIPIVVSMIVFGFRGAIIVAIVSGVAVLVSAFIHLGIFTDLISGANPFIISPRFSNTLLQSGVIFILYLLTGFFGGYISRLMRARDVLLHEQIASEEVHVVRLEELTKAFDQSAKLLVRRDLELTSANDKLIQLDKMKSEIISVVAHQLRTPLSAIKWSLKIILDKDAGELTPQQEELLKKSFTSNERMITLINDMLAVDKLESGKLKYDFVVVQFEDIVQDMIRSLLTLATKKNIRVEFSSPRELLPKIKVDVDKLRDVLQNLIDNAIKYTNPGGTVSVGATKENDEIHFWVKDDGIGIPADEQEKIFGRFFRASNASRFASDGSGLGLFITQSIVKRHGGKLWFESKIGSGSVFHVTLPLS